MFLLCRLSDGRCWVIERFDGLEEARQKKAESEEHLIILRRKDGGYYLVQDNGTDILLSEAEVA